MVAAAKLVEVEENQRNGAAKNRAVYAIIGLRKSSIGGGTDDPMRRGLAAYGYYGISFSISRFVCIDRVDFWYSTEIEVQSTSYSRNHFE